MFAHPCLLTAIQPARADKVYTYVDEDGVLVLTNVPPGSAKKAMRTRTDGDVTTVSAPLEFAPNKDTQSYDTFIQEACALYKIPPALVRAVMAAESNFNPKQNIMGGVRYLRILANQFKGDMVQIVAAYNAGPEAVRRAGGIPAIEETQEYVKRVLRLYFAFKTEMNQS